MLKAWKHSVENRHTTQVQTLQSIHVFELVCMRDHVFVVTCIRGGARWVVYIWSFIDPENVSNVRIRTAEIALDL